MALFSRVPIFVDWTSMTHLWGLKFVAIVFSFIIHKDKQIQRIVVPRAATNLRGKGQGQGHDMVPIERAYHKEHACQISMLYL